MKYRRLGASGPEVSTIAMGCWTIAGGAMWGNVAEREAIRTIHAAIDSGITLLDTAEGYGDGDSEDLIGKALSEAGSRNRVLIATKVGPDNFSEQDLVRSCETSLRRLGTDVIDLYQLHWPRVAAVPVPDALETMGRLREQGKIRFIGVCNFGVPDLEGTGVPGEAIISDQLPYSPLWRVIEQEIMQLVQARGMGVLTYSTLVHGLLAGKFRNAADVPDSRARTRHFSGNRPSARHGEAGQEELTFQTVHAVGSIAAELGLSLGDLSLAWALHQPGVTSVLAGARNAGQIEANARAADIELPSEALERIDEATAALKGTFGLNPDMWQTPGRSGYTGRPAED